jgi:hypothetical protein
VPEKGDTQIVTTPIKSDSGFSEPEKVIEEFKQKLDQVLQLEKEKLCEVIDREAKFVITKAYQEAANINSKAQEQSRQILSLAEERAVKESEQMLADAHKTAADRVEKETVELMARAVIEVQQQKEMLLAKAVAEARSAGESEAKLYLQKASQEAENLVKSANEKVRSQINESSRLMLEIQQKMNQMGGLIGIDINQNVKEPEVKGESIQAANPDSTTVKGPTADQVKSKPAAYDNEAEKYQGKFRIDLVPPVSQESLKYLEQYLSNTAGIKVINRGQAEDHSAWIEIDLARPLSILDILRKVPIVKDVVGCKSYIIVSFNSSVAGLN